MRKNIIYLVSLALLMSVLFIGCDEEPEIWMSSTADFDGNWFLRYDHSYYGIDPFGAGRTEHYTYNTSDNDGLYIWLDDDGNFWDYKVKVPVDKSTLTFGSNDTLTSIVDGYEIKVLIRNGIIVKDAVTLPSTSVVDSIYFEVWFEDLAGSTGIISDTLFVSGYRKTGFEEDEDY